MHTESATDVDNTLGQLFTEWDVRLDDHCVGVRRNATTGYADRLDRAHAAAHEVVRQVGRAGEVVGDAAERDPAHGQAGLAATVLGAPSRGLVTARSRAGRLAFADFGRTGHKPDNSPAHCTTTGASSRTRASVMRAVGPAMLTVPTVAPSAPERMAAAAVNHMRALL